MKEKNALSFEVINYPVITKIKNFNEAFTY
jgi:hypothetical protein